MRDFQQTGKFVATADRSCWIDGTRATMFTLELVSTSDPTIHKVLDRDKKFGKASWWVVYLHHNNSFDAVAVYEEEKVARENTEEFLLTFMVKNAELVSGGRQLGPKSPTLKQDR